MKTTKNIFFQNSLKIVKKNDTNKKKIKRNCKDIADKKLLQNEQISINQDNK